MASQVSDGIAAFHKITFWRMINLGEFTKSTEKSPTSLAGTSPTDFNFFPARNIKVFAPVTFEAGTSKKIKLGVKLRIVDDTKYHFSLKSAEDSTQEVWFQNVTGQLQIADKINTVSFRFPDKRLATNAETCDAESVLLQTGLNSSDNAFGTTTTTAATNLQTTMLKSPTLFGATETNAARTAPSSMFGATISNAARTITPPSSMFGATVSNAARTTPPSSMFGATESNAARTTPPLFTGSFTFGATPPSGNTKREVDGSVILSGTVLVPATSEETAIVEEQHKVTDHSLGEELKKYFKSETHSDVDIIVNNKCFPSHKVILSARSTVLQKIIDNMEKLNDDDEANNVIVLRDIESDVFEEVLHFIYTDTCSEIREFAMKLLPLAEKYKIFKLKNLCEKELSTVIKTSNVCELLYLASTESAKKLQKKCFAFMRGNYKVVMQTTAWKQFRQKNPVLASIVLEDVLLGNDD